MLLAESYLHQLDPYAIQFTESFGLRWYGLSYAAGFLIGWLFVHWMARTNRTPLKPERVGDFVMYIVAGVLIGGRLGHAIFYSAGEPLWTFTSQFPYWELLAINRGGMASHGGIIGVILACAIFGWRHRISAKALLDMCAFICTAGFFLGRIANFINGELWGKALPAEQQADTPWWSIKYPEEVIYFAAEKQEMLFAKLGDTIGGGEHFMRNVVRAAYEGNQQVIDVIRPMLTAFYPSQLVQAVAEGPILMGALALIWLKPRKPGVIGSWFLVIYGVLRVLTEIVRAPDEGVAVIAGLQRGQLLSVAMILAGLICVWWASTRDAPRIGGLRHPVKVAQENDRLAPAE